MSRFVRLNMNPELNDDQDCTICAQNTLMQCNMSMEQFMQNPQATMNQLVQSGAIPQEVYNQAVQRANQAFPRR